MQGAVHTPTSLFSTAQPEARLLISPPFPDPASWHQAQSPDFSLPWPTLEEDSLLESQHESPEPC